MASIKQLDERRYKITVSNGYRPNGKKISKSKTIQVPPGVPKRGIGQYVAHAAEELECSFKTGYAEDGEMTFEEFASRWLKRQTKYAPSTIAAYRRMLEVVYPMIGGIRLNKLRPMVLENMLSALRKRKHHGKLINKSTVQRYLSVVSAVLSDAKRNEIIEKNPARMLDLSTPQRTVQHRRLGIADILGHTAVIGGLEAEGGVGLAHPIAAALAETALAAGDDLVGGDALTQLIFLHILAYGYDTAQELMAGDKGGLDPGGIRLIAPETLRAVHAFQVAGADAAALSLDEDVIGPALGDGIVGLQLIIMLAVGNQCLHRLGNHIIKSPFCEKRQWGYITRTLSLSKFICYYGLFIMCVYVLCMVRPCGFSSIAFFCKNDKQKNGS